MQCFAEVYKAAFELDQSKITQFIGDSSLTLNNTISLMQMTSDFMAELETWRIQVLLDDLDTSDPSGAMKAQADQTQYNVVSMEKDSKTQLLQNTANINKQNVDSDNSARSSYFSVVQAVNGNISFLNALVSQKM